MFPVRLVVRDRGWPVTVSLGGTRQTRFELFPAFTEAHYAVGNAGTIGRGETRAYGQENGAGRENAYSARAVARAFGVLNA